MAAVHVVLCTAWLVPHNVHAPHDARCWRMPHNLHAPHDARCGRILLSAADVWQDRVSELQGYAAMWGNADPPANTGLGKWCILQRRMHAANRLSKSGVEDLERLNFSWVAPSSLDSPDDSIEFWSDMCSRFAAYREEHGDGQVPKKFQPDPTLGGWVAAVRRRREMLGLSRVSQLDSLGFEWKSTRQCGSAFMQSFRQLREFWEVHGHTEVDAVLGTGSELARWCDVQRAAKTKGMLPDKRLAYLEGIGFEWTT